jgi:hypothetical protein
MLSLRRIAAGIALSQVLTGLAAFQVLSPAVAASSLSAPVAAMTAPIYHRVKPANLSNLATPWADEASAAASLYGYTMDLGVPFRASVIAATGLTPVRRLFKSTTGDFAWALAGSTVLTSLQGQGYVDQGTNFFASAGAVTGETAPIDTYLKAGKRRLASSATSAALIGDGWVRDYTAFHVPASSVAGGTTTTPTPEPPPTSATGSAPVGSTAYPVPTAAVVFASPGGNDGWPGTVSAPVRTLAQAIALAPSGGTIVLRAGSYHESVTLYGKAVTIQSYPNEAVWFDGSEPVTGWVSDGAAWRRDNWTLRFDHSPTYTQGAPDSTSPYWQFVNPAHPMAAYPDQVFVDGVAQQQVASRSQVTTGTFFLDEATSKLYLGTNPTGRAVAASTLIKALSVRTPDVTIRGVGFRRYSPSVFHVGAITLEQPRAAMENVVIEDMATTGVSLQREDIKLTNVTVARSGMLGIHGRFADRMRLASVLSTRNNVERFNLAPVSGGAKVGLSRGVTVVDSDFVGNYGHGFWEDMSDYNSVFRGSRFTDNTGTGLFLEISARAVVGDCLFARNGEFGIKVNNTSNVQIWNNTFMDNANRPVNLVQDSRRNTKPTDPAVDPRIAWPDPEMPWTLGPVTFRNNVVSGGGGNCVQCVEDYSGQRTAEQMGISLDANVYHRPGTSTPTWLVVWSRGPGNPYVFTSLAQARTTVGIEPRGREFTGAAIVDSAGTLTSSVASLESQIAVALPSAVATLIARPAGSVHLGHW